MRANKQDYDEKMIKFTEEFKTMLALITDYINTLKYSSTQKDEPKPTEPTTVAIDNRRAPPLGGGQSTEIGGMCTLKH